MRGTHQTVLEDFDLEPGSQGDSPFAEEPGERNLTFHAKELPAVGERSLTGGYKTRFRLGPRRRAPGSRSTGTSRDLAAPTTACRVGPPAVHDLKGQIVLSERYSLLDGPGCSKDDMQCVVTGVHTITGGTYPGPLPGTTSGSTLPFDADTATTGVAPHHLELW